MDNETATSKPTKTTRASTSKGKKTKNTAKSTTSKTRSAKISKTANKSETAAMGITQQQRQIMIQEMAYLIAERRGFSDGNPNEDWLVAESQVDAQLLSGATQG